MKKTTQELQQMTKKELRDYIMIALNQYIPNYYTKLELRMMVYIKIGVRA